MWTVFLHLVIYLLDNINCSLKPVLMSNWGSHPKLSSLFALRTDLLNDYNSFFNFTG